MIIPKYSKEIYNSKNKVRVNFISDKKIINYYLYRDERINHSKCVLKEDKKIFDEVKNVMEKQEMKIGDIISTPETINYSSGGVIHSIVKMKNQSIKKEDIIICLEKIKLHCIQQGFESVIIPMININNVSLYELRKIYSDCLKVVNTSFYIVFPSR
ncbi:hypothetical protein [Terribacillus saccharophilus]|uniref:hypothetical protein n=1 Tax=Terribacillus saccharophilus TaxID=361277 RepID=UPI002989B37A|nr:hypothetical protein [Terribacillus saccharophilus]MCM3227533.1 hypothetical protein [Terribacillus saccharophilus]